MKRILKTVLAIGLVASSSLAVAEGKFAYRQQLKGVDASPTFGMTEQEKQEHLSNVEMCSNEGVFETGEHEETIIYNVEITLEAGVPVYNKDFGTYWQVQNCSAYPAGQAYPRPHVDGKRVDNSLFIRGDYRSSVNCGNRDHFYEIIPKEDYTYIGRKMEKKPIFAETENYQWCKNNGYNTAN